MGWGWMTAFLQNFALLLGCLYTYTFYRLRHLHSFTKILICFSTEIIFVSSSLQYFAVPSQNSTDILITQTDKNMGWALDKVNSLKKTSQHKGYSLKKRLNSLHSNLQLFIQQLKNRQNLSKYNTAILLHQKPVTDKDTFKLFLFFTGNRGSPNIIVEWILKGERKAMRHFLLALRIVDLALIVNI